MVPTAQLFSDKILYVEGLLEDPVGILEIIEKTDTGITDRDVVSKWYSWKSSSNDYMFGQKKDLFFHNTSSSSEETLYVFNQLNNAMAVAQTIYSEKTGTRLGNHQPMCINKYFTGKMMGPHVDGDEGSENNPVMSAVLYINDDYLGGELDFPNQGVTIKPSAGSVIMFPSTQPFIHNPKEILAGEKVMCPAFWFDS
jgi:predicted 2-oxoglutarate/Fe(II)-dependent dioxygenase YbiX